jgi:hypothetical protein
MSSALTNASRLKPEIRLAQAISQFEADLSSEQKASFRTSRSQSSPVLDDVMRLTAEIDRRASGKGGAVRVLGPRLTNFLQAVQQFAALGDIVVGGSQNLIACGVWSLVRMSLLVGVLLTLVAFSTNISLVDCELLFLPWKTVDSSHDRRSLGSTLPSDGFTLSPIQESTIAPL